MPTGAHSVEDGRVADDDREAAKCESKQEEKHFGRSANTRIISPSEFTKTAPAPGVTLDRASESVLIFP